MKENVLCMIFTVFESKELRLKFITLPVTQQMCNKLCLSYQERGHR